MLCYSNDNFATVFSAEEKREEHQWLCFLRKSSNALFSCHCCDHQFYKEDKWNHHEFLCSLKLPPGSSFSCKYCDTKISLHNHSSFIHHEKHCLLNPSVSAACAVLHKHHSNGEFIDAEAMRTTSKRAKLHNAPLCTCPVDPERCLQIWSTSEGNRGNMHYRCSKFNKEDRCKFFKWSNQAYLFVM